jgi:dTDP-4-amino-4,6-dideoxygalactose transaminase
VLLTTSCTASMEVVALSLGLAPGDEVILPSFTFVSTANAFATYGATPIFADIRPDTLNIDENQLPSLITEKTKAIVVVHYGGVSCEMDTIMAIAQQHGISVVEDNAHGLFGKYRGKQLGTIGNYGALSFHATKNFQSGQGGALVIRDAAAAETARIVRENGTNRSAFERGEVARYTWVGQGTNALPSELIGAVLLAQLEQREAIQKRRGEIWIRYMAELSEWAQRQGVQLPHVPEGCETSFHIFHLILPDEESRDRFAAHLASNGILVVSHYVPLNSSPMGKRLGGFIGQCPITEDLSNRLIRLPLYFSLSESEQGEVIEAVLEWNANA